MRVAIATDSGHVAAHFGRCPEYTIVDIEDNKVKEKSSFINPGHSPGLIPQVMNEKGVKCMIAGGMGGRAIGFFQEYGIETIIGISGTVEETIDKLIKGSLKGGESFCNPGAGKEHYGQTDSTCGKN